MCGNRQSVINQNLTGILKLSLTSLPKHLIVINTFYNFYSVCTIIFKIMRKYCHSISSSECDNKCSFVLPGHMPSGADSNRISFDKEHCAAIERLQRCRQTPLKRYFTCSSRAQPLIKPNAAADLLWPTRNSQKSTLLVRDWPQCSLKSPYNKQTNGSLSYILKHASAVKSTKLELTIY